MHNLIWKLLSTTTILAAAAGMAVAQDHGDKGGSRSGGGSSHSSGSSGSGRSGGGSGSGSYPARTGSSASGSSGWHTYRSGSYPAGSSSYRSSQTSAAGGSSFGRRAGDFGGSNHNVAAAGRTEAVEPVRIARAPSAIFRGNGRGAAPAFEHGGLYRGGWRSGSYHYNHFFHDDHFFFGFYVFDPFAFGVCVCSPWYYYPCLPPYLAYDHVVVVDNFYSTDWAGQPYPYQPDAAPSNNSPELDGALHDIVAAFQDDDRRALSHLVPRSGKVNIFTEGNYSYSLSADDFFDLYKDGIENVHTDKYVIEDVQVNDKGDARVKARHDYMDPWNKPQTVIHTYYLAHEGHDFVIREFGTSYYDK